MLLKTNQVSIYVLFYITFISFSYQDVYSQIPHVKSDGEKIKLSDFRGTPYLQKEFQKGVVYDGLTGKEKKIFLRYDALNDVFEMKNTKMAKNSDFLKKTFEMHVIMDNKTFYYQNYTNSIGENSVGYLHEVAQVGDKKFYIKYGKNLIMPEKAKTSLEQDRPGKIRDDRYFVVGDANNLISEKINKKTILNHVPSRFKEEFKSFIKKSKLKFKEADDFKKLGDFYMTLK